MTLNTDQFLPGMEAMREALPHEQTEAQFHNRPNVFVHGRYEPTARGSRELDLHPGNHREANGFHAGTEQSAHDRLESLGKPYFGHEPRFYHGLVDPAKMRNTAVPGNWESDEHGIRHYNDPGRTEDEGEDWTKRHHDQYYRNDYEDKGSTSVILSTTADRTGAGTRFAPNNFTTHREAVHLALASGEHVPAHVQAIYEATGGADGPRSVRHPHFQPPSNSSPYRKTDDPFPQLDGGWAINQKKYGPSKYNKFVPLRSHEETYDYGGYGSAPSY